MSRLKPDETSQEGIFAVYWESNDSYTIVRNPDNVNNHIPDNVKLSIAQSLIDDLRIQIRLEPRRDVR